MLVEHVIVCKVLNLSCIKRCLSRQRFETLQVFLFQRIKQVLVSVTYTRDSSSSELRGRFAPFNWFKPSSKIFY